MTIILLGYMGCGKSSVGITLATHLNYKFIDLDDFIEQQEQQSISEIFKTKGDLYFRKIEHQALDALLAKKDIVLALGGGTPCYFNNMERINKASNTISIYLKATINTLKERLINERSKRPLISGLKNEQELKEYISKHLFERGAFYNLSQHIIAVDHKTIQELTQDILAILNQHHR
jgi:shikimate kinase